MVILYAWTVKKGIQMTRQTFEYAPGLEYNHKEHTYFYKDKEVSGVTNILNCAGLSDFSYIDDEILTRSMDFGTKVHILTEFDDTKRLGNYDPKLEPSLKAWRKFKEDFKVKIIPEYIELKVFSKKYFYAGTLDRLVLVRGNYFLIDIKTGVYQQSHAIQTAAYEQAFKELFKFKKKIYRGCVYLDGEDYKLREHTSVGDFNVFLSALNITKYFFSMFIPTCPRLKTYQTVNFFPFIH